jgi:hypothetical protein
MMNETNETYQGNIAAGKTGSVNLSITLPPLYWNCTYTPVIDAFILLLYYAHTPCHCRPALIAFCPRLSH